MIKYKQHRDSVIEFFVSSSDRILILDCFKLPTERCYIQFRANGIAYYTDWISVQDEMLVLLLKAVLNGTAPVEAFVDYILETDIVREHIPVYTFTQQLSFEQLDKFRSLFKAALAL